MIKVFSITVPEIGDSGVRSTIKEHLEREATGLIPPWLEANIAWVELCILCTKKKSLWVCIPVHPPNKDAFKSNWEKVLSNWKEQPLKFSYMNLLEQIIKNSSDPEEIEKLLNIPHFTITYEQNKTPLISVIPNDSRLLESIYSLQECQEYDLENWIKFVRDQFDFSEFSHHTFFFILRPGVTNFLKKYYGHGLFERLIGGALVLWNGKPPSDLHISFLRRMFINALFFDLGETLDLLKVSETHAKIYFLLQFLQKHPFGNDNPQIHDDTEFFFRREICYLLKGSIFSDNYDADSCCPQCPSASIKISQKKEYDFCTILNEYKGMFEIEEESRVDRVKFTYEHPDSDKLTLFRAVMRFFELENDSFKVFPEDDENNQKVVVLPYRPGCLFLATVKLLRDTLPEGSEFVLDAKEKKMKISFQMDPPSSEKNYINKKMKLRTAVKEEKRVGDTARAILDLLYGRLVQLANTPLFLRLKNYDLVKKLISGPENARINNEENFKIEVNDEKECIIEITW